MQQQPMNEIIKKQRSTGHGILKDLFLQINRLVFNVVCLTDAAEHGYLTSMAQGWPQNFYKALYTMDPREIGFAELISTQLTILADACAHHVNDVTTKAID
jgi:murein tripeptide amidase MpaA